MLKYISVQYSHLVQTCWRKTHLSRFDFRLAHECHDWFEVWEPQQKGRFSENNILNFSLFLRRSYWTASEDLWGIPVGRKFEVRTIISGRQGLHCPASEIKPISGWWPSDISHLRTNSFSTQYWYVVLGSRRLKSLFVSTLSAVANYHTVG